VSGTGVLIVGGGLAAQRCTETLRARGHEAPIRIVCGEPEAPYDRPPLSKGLLAGEIDETAVRFRDRGWYADNRVELRLGKRTVALDPEAHRVELEDGRSLAYDKLLIATGAAPRRLEQFAGFANAHCLRTVADTRGLRADLEPGARLLVIGAGFIGQEVAATAVDAGVEVTMIEALPLPLAGLLGERLGRWLVDLHADQGVEMLLSTRVVEARGNGRVEEVVLDSGRRLACNAVVVGVGVAPAAGWLAGSGLDTDGVLIDPSGRTAVPDVFAAGDVARAYDPCTAAYSRTEHWDAASRQGAAAARGMLGEKPAQQPPTSFWSDQYGLRIQYVGNAAGADAIDVDGDPGSRDFSVLFSRDERPVAAFTVGRPRELIALRRLIVQAHPRPNQNEEASK
jgi:3-phenylpropionate/trans-cinnamate dioxygenase ferredoxin reductase component